MVLPFSLVLLLVFGWAVSVLAGFANSAFRDIQHFSSIGFQVLFYLTPIIYPRGTQDGNLLGKVFQYNPLVPFLEIVRKPLDEGMIPSFETYLAATLATLAVTAGAILLLQRLQKRVILYL
jgi:ABC-type polysaccharide/polyol phosphate export permease